jgi:hypothetical protein
VHLGGEHDGVTLPVTLQRLSDHLFAGAGAVDVGRIQKVDAGVDGAVDDPERVLLAGPPPEHHASETQLADLYARPSKAPVLYRFPFLRDNLRFIQQVAKRSRKLAV